MSHLRIHRALILLFVAIGGIHALILNKLTYLLDLRVALIVTIVVILARLVGRPGDALEVTLSKVVQDRLYLVQDVAQALAGTVR